MEYSAKDRKNVVKAQLQLLGIRPENTPPRDYGKYEECADLINQYIEECETSEQTEDSNDLAYLLRRGEIHNHIMPFMSFGAAHPVGDTTRYGYLVHPMTDAVNMELFRRRDDLELPFVTNISRTKKKTDRHPYYTFSYTVSILHHIADFTGNAAPLNNWTEVITVDINNYDAGLLIAGCIQDERQNNVWIRLRKEPQTAVDYLAEHAKLLHTYTPGVYQQKCEMLRDIIQAIKDTNMPRTTDGLQESLGIINRLSDFSTFRLEYDNAAPRLSDIRENKDGIIACILTHTFGNPNCTYEETFEL